MRITTRLFALAMATLFLVGCWGEDIKLRAPAKNDQTSFQSKGKEKRILMEKLGKAPAKAAPAAPAPAAPAAPAEGGTK